MESTYIPLYTLKGLYKVYRENPVEFEIAALDDEEIELLTEWGIKYELITTDINGYIKRNVKVFSNSKTQDKKAYIIANPDMSNQEIAKVLNCSEKYIQNLRTQINNSSETQKKRDYIAAHPDMSIADIAKVLNCSKSDIYYLKERVVRPASETQKKRDYIAAHPDMKIRDLAEALKCSVNQICVLKRAIKKENQDLLNN